MNYKFALALSSALSLLLYGCGGGGDKPAQRIEVPVNAAENWITAQPSEVGMDGAVLNRALSNLPAAEAHGLASMVVMRHGKAVLEQYWNGYNKDTLHDLRSATKSITSLKVGIAIDQHMVAGVDEPISTSLGPVYPDAPALKRNITIDNVLTMRSGLACDDRNSTSPGNEDKMYGTADWVRYFLSLPQYAAPGSETHYCTGGAVALGRVIAEASKVSVPVFSDTWLFAPLGITGVRWADFDTHRQTDTGGHLQMRPRDLAKLGQLVAQNGMWNGKQVVSAAWIAQATSPHTVMDGKWDYGYLWWMQNEPFQGRQVTMRFAWGNGGQYIFVIPELDLVAVFTGENYNSVKAEYPFLILENYVLPSIL